MNIKPYTSEMKETIMRMANKGWKYLKHIKSGNLNILESIFLIMIIFQGIG
jgi:hypothetical protein